MIAYIGIGSNLGDRRSFIARGIELLNGKGIAVRRVSPLYETKAVCRPGQTMPDFLNGVIQVETDLTPMELKQSLETIEKELGRKEKGSWAPRNLDLDILFYGDRVIDQLDLKIPHPEIPQRWFVLKPMCDLDAELVHPVMRRTVKELFEEINHADLH